MTALSEEALESLVCAFRANGRSQRKTAQILGKSRSTVREQLKRAVDEGLLKPEEFRSRKDIGMDFDPGFSTAPLPTGDIDVEELIDQRLALFERKHKAEEARNLIDVKIKVKGPYALVHFGDPHVDDDGCNWPQLLADLDTVKSTKAMFGCNVGDLQNNWVGRLARLYGEQTTSRRQAWQLTEWLVKEIPWLYLIKGNHDMWTGTGDPLDYMMQGGPGVMEAWSIRLNLISPNGREVRVNARHDFPGHSQWNPTHGPMKAAQFGWRDHILVCGHKHTSGYGILQDPASGLISHAIRAAGYKHIDSYAKVGGFLTQNFGPAAVTIVDPDAEKESGLVTVLWDVQTAAEYLNYLRKARGYE